MSPLVALNSTRRVPIMLVRLPLVADDCSGFGVLFELTEYPSMITNKSSMLGSVLHSLSSLQ
jgi:hypothetical protein